MQREFTEAGSVKYLEVRQMYEKKKERVHRIFSWSFKSQSHSKNEWGRNYVATFEIFVPRPKERDFLRLRMNKLDVKPLIYVRYKNSKGYVVEDYTLDRFQQYPFYNMLNEKEKQDLIDATFEAHNIIMVLMERISKGMKNKDA